MTKGQLSLWAKSISSCTAGSRGHPGCSNCQGILMRLLLPWALSFRISTSVEFLWLQERAADPRPQKRARGWAQLPGAVQGAGRTGGCERGGYRLWAPSSGGERLSPAGWSSQDPGPGVPVTHEGKQMSVPKGGGRGAGRAAVPDTRAQSRTDAARDQEAELLSLTWPL